MDSQAAKHATTLTEMGYETKAKQRGIHLD